LPKDIERERWIIGDHKQERVSALEGLADDSILVPEAQKNIWKTRPFRRGQRLPSRLKQQNMLTKKRSSCAGG